MVIYIVGSYSFIRDTSFGMSLNEIRTFLTGSKNDFNGSSSSSGRVTLIIGRLLWFTVIFTVMSPLSDLVPCGSFD